MVNNMLRSRSQKRTKKKTPGARLKTYYSRKKESKKRCSICKRTLHGFSKGAKTSKRPSRIKPELCGSCLKSYLIKKVRGQQ